MENQQTVSVQPFSATLAEKLAVPVSFIVAFIYTYIGIDNASYVWLAIFTLLFCAAGELFYFRSKASLESWIWLGSLFVIVISVVAGRNRVWGEISWLFVHAYAVYWIINRADRMTDGASGRFLPLDALNGLIILPFKNFFLRTKVIWSVLTGAAKAKGKASIRIGIIAAVLFSAILLYVAGSLLAAADDAFEKIIGDFLRLFKIENFGEILFRFIISLPIGAYLYGLVVGMKREDKEKISARGSHALQIIETIRIVPAFVWSVILSLFILMYFAFFAIQGSYLFGAFSNTLPETFTISQYARQGFFELCAIMALNFSLLWIVVKTGSDTIREKRTNLVLLTILLAQSILFSVTAFSKLYMYIDGFGFTPLRLQSTWLICMLFAGCVAAVYSIWLGRKFFRIWIFLSGITLALLHIY